MNQATSIPTWPRQRIAHLVRCFWLLTTAPFLAALGLATFAPCPVKAAPPDMKTPLAFEFSYAAADKERVGKLPYFRVFPGGKDKNDLDASSALNTLKFARGASKLYPQEDAKPGLIVLLRRIIFVPTASGDYTALLEGEFNAVRTVVKQEMMEKLLSGEMTDLVIESDTTKGIRPVAFNVRAITRFRAALRDGNLVFYGGEGRSTVTHYALTRNYVYESDPVPLGPDDNTEPIYIGRAVKPTYRSDGTLVTLPIIN